MNSENLVHLREQLPYSTPLIDRVAPVNADIGAVLKGVELPPPLLPPKSQALRQRHGNIQGQPPPLITLPPPDGTPLHRQLHLTPLREYKQRPLPEAIRRRWPVSASQNVLSFRQSLRAPLRHLSDHLLHRQAPGSILGEFWDTRSLLNRWGVAAVPAGVTPPYRPSFTISPTDSAPCAQWLRRVQLGLVPAPNDLCSLMQCAYHSLMLHTPFLHTDSKTALFRLIASFMGEATPISSILSTTTVH